MRYLSGLKDKEGDALGRFNIPRVDETMAILHEITPKALRLDVTHIRGVPFSGEGGDVGNARRRDTWSRSLKNIRAGDDIQIETFAWLFQYKVDWVRIVAPNDKKGLALSTEP